MKIVTVIGARPQFIKCAPVSKAIRDLAGADPSGQKGMKEIVIHTGQHYDYMMSKVFFDELGIPSPDYNLGVGSGSHGRQTGEMLIKIEEVLLKEKPDVMMIYGDTNSTLAGALAASKLHIPVVHIEAGLRSYNMRMPEEINRVMSDHVSSLLLCPTLTAVRNLEKEGFSNIANGGGTLVKPILKDEYDTSLPLVINIGDVMYDAMLMGLDIAQSRLGAGGLTAERGISRYCLATVHRAENTDVPARLDKIISSFVGISEEMPVVWPAHPRTRKLLDANYPMLAEHKGLVITEPVGYYDMLMLEKNASVILTDSGGVQKEAYWLKVPCVTLRDETEWVETVESGCNMLARPGQDDIGEVFHRRLSTAGDFKGRLYGDGSAGRTLASLLMEIYG
ncbi:MAG: UDP-N-acetylglucosamine 2-epimerase (non-hydrolyzing) [Nitrospirae bacterium]|nr:UDP-N-acetylglucosamine 2-epimerase (non-hydrolyzing) [Nitrospirota bacterium]